MDKLIAMFKSENPITPQPMLYYKYGSEQKSVKRVNRELINKTEASLKSSRFFMKGTSKGSTEPIYIIHNIEVTIEDKI